jgi:4-hydroxy-tetrahydrodipicolinate reductase
MRVLLLGYGKMGRLVESLAPQYGCEVVGIVDPLRGGDGVDSDRWRGVDVAIDFTTPEAVPANMALLAGRGINMVVGTTGWGSHQPELRRMVSEAGIGVVVAPNFSTGVVLFEALAGAAAKLFSTQPDFSAFIHESHHAAKKDAPSGTALLLKSVMEASGYMRPIDVASTRAGHIPGTHSIGFDGPAETVTLTHTARDRTAFARGALGAAAWIKGRRGWYTMHDVLGLSTGSS